MKKALIISLALCLVFGMAGVAAALPNYTMSWDFETFGNPNARQVAVNTAETHNGLVEEAEDPIERFAEGLDRRLYSSAQRDIVDMIMDEEQVATGEYEAGDLNISVAEDPQTGEVIVEITDMVSGDSTIITYSSDDWDSGLNY